RKLYYDHRALQSYAPTPREAWRPRDTRRGRTQNTAAHDPRDERPPHRRHARDTRTPRTPFRARAKPARHAGGSYVCLRRNSMTMTQALGWALVHSLWQCALAAAGLAALLAVLPPRAARARYALAVATLALTLALPIGTLVRLHDASPETTAGSPITAAPAPASRAPAASPEPMPLSPQATHRYGSAAPAIAVLRLVPPIRARLELLLPWIVVLWLTGVVALSLRLASGWLAARRLRALGIRPAPEPCVAALRRLAARLRVSQPVRLLQSTLVQVPAVLGWVRPVILLPASALTGLTPLQLEALLA